jgi:hypothetical protein
MILMIARREKLVLRKYYIRRSIGGRQAFCLAEQSDQVEGETPPG